MYSYLALFVAGKLQFSFLCRFSPLNTPLHLTRAGSRSPCRRTKVQTSALHRRQIGVTRVPRLSLRSMDWPRHRTPRGDLLLVRLTLPRSSGIGTINRPGWNLNDVMWFGWRMFLKFILSAIIPEGNGTLQESTQILRSLRRIRRLFPTASGSQTGERVHSGLTIRSVKNFC